MDPVSENQCVLILHRDVFVQFQSIQLATKLDTNAQMEMFFQLYHCVKTAHFKVEDVNISITADAKVKSFTNIANEDSVNYEMLPITEDSNNQRLQSLTEYKSTNNKEHSSPVMDETNGLSSSDGSLKGDKQSVENKNPSVSFSLNNRERKDLSESSGADCYKEQLINNTGGNSQQIPFGTEIANTPVRKGRRKSAPKRAAPVVDDDDIDTLDMQLLVKQECLGDDSYLFTDGVEPTADKDHMNTASDSYLPQSLPKYTKDASFELPTMVRGTNYSPMTSASRQHTGFSSVYDNNHDTSKNIHRNSVSAQVLKKQGHLRTIAMGLKRKFDTLSGMHESSNCESEMDGTDILSDFGDISDDYGYGTILKCEFCSFTSHRRYNLNRHRRIHTGTMFKCETCGRKFNEPGKLKSHSCKLPVPKSPNKPMYSCNICSTTSLKSVEALRQHMQLEHDIAETYVCVSCNPQVIFHNPQEFKNHLETSHTVGRSLSTSFCNECGREFKYLRSLQKHKLSCVITMYKLKPMKEDNIPSTSISTD